MTKNVSISKVAIQPKTEIKAEFKKEFKELQAAMTAIQDRMSKLARDGYDEGYNEDVGSKEPMPAANAVPGVPGTHDAQSPDGGAGNYDGGYAAPVEPNKAEAKADGKDNDSDDDMDECTCDKCGSKYKAKKVAKKDESEEAKEDVMPKKAEGFGEGASPSKVVPENKQEKMEYVLDFGSNNLDAKRPETVATSIDFKALFGIPTMAIIDPNSNKAKMDKIIFEELAKAGAKMTPMVESIELPVE